MTHAIIRTNKKGEPFVGRCKKCGENGLRMSAALDACPMDDLVSDEAALLDILNKPDPT